jgi:L-ascorbate metabolism protein UlaG (beta-lactamase superfamily)
MLDRFTWFRQAAFLWKGDGLTLAIDPWNVTSDGPIDLILITHSHEDHFRPEQLQELTTEGRTKLVAPRQFASDVPGDVTPVEPGDSLEVAGVKIQAVPAYNVVDERLDKHPKSNRWVGYVLELDGHTYYHAGDTDHLQELESLKTDVAFVPIGGTYTMDVPEAAGYVKAMGPSLAVPMHFGFVVGEPEDGQRFAQAAAPVPVQIMDSVDPMKD